MKNNIVIYKYSQNGVKYDVSFLNNINNIMINVTDMVKPFGKNIGHFLDDPTRREITYKYCTRNSKSLSINDIDIPMSLNFSNLAKMFPESVNVVRGGLNKQQGTWVHKGIALEIARWLSADFSIWCNDRIEELLRYGYSFLVTTTPNTVQENTKHQVQRNNSKAIAMKNYGFTKDQGNIIKHYRDIMFKLVGVYPNQIVQWAKKNDVPRYIINKGAREILRYINSSVPSMLSLVENIASSTPDYNSSILDELVKYAKDFEPFFKRMIEIGYGDRCELEKAKEYETIKKALYEKNLD
ncbi:KilA-N domain-containing protein [Candidatus Vampirococcus lugosii]|uniref:DNA binding protein, containing KilA-N domain n=1 Tax=Candidatus Vampirococcus lugosii TaxID=2789015 RepID=A0ABS5QLV2_9BACT|nr:KilA-N domain-containing protein [Candidatus Vampirococcus lugosii]MBS8122118.1 DNA binding protein, containing KilA-N domain [Candidatus Vampirococcus lugosii]